MAILELIHVTPAAIGRRAAVAFAFTARGHPRRSFRVAALHIRLRPMRVFPSSRSLRLAAPAALRGGGVAMGGALRFGDSG